MELYSRVVSLDRAWAEKGIALAPRFGPEDFVWVAVKDRAFYVLKEDTTLLAQLSANEDAKLEESLSPNLATYRESAILFRMGCSLMSSDVDRLKAGMQLCVDAYLADSNCAMASSPVIKKMADGLLCLHQTPGAVANFGMTGALFELVITGLMGPHAGPSCRPTLDHIIPQIPESKWPKVKAALLFSRSYDSHFRLGNHEAGRRDLDAAISLDDSYRDSRIPLFLAVGDLHGAKADLEDAVQRGHPDDRFYSGYCLALAAFYAKLDDVDRGRTYYDDGLKSQRRRNYLFGTFRDDRRTTAMAFFEDVAHSVYGGAENVENDDDLERSITRLVGLPHDAARTFLKTKTPPSSLSSFAKGDYVVLTNLQSDAGRKHNGALAKVVRLPVNGRYAVNVVNGPKKNFLQVKPGNLRRPSDAEVTNAAGKKRLDDDALPSPGNVVIGDLVRQALNNGQGPVETRDVHDSDHITPAVIAEAKAAITGTTDVDYNEAHPCDDGDQSFLRASLATDPGLRLKAARADGMDFSMAAMSPFARACYLGLATKVEAAIRMTEQRHEKKRLRRLVSERETMLRFTPLHICIAGSQRIMAPDGLLGSHDGGAQWIAVARALLEAGAPPDAKDVAGYTCLHLATFYDKEGPLAIAALLCQFGADPNNRNRFGAAPLLEAVQAGRIDACRVLVEHGADPGLEDLSNKAMTPEERRAGDDRTDAQFLGGGGIFPPRSDGRYRPITPMSLAMQCHPAAQRLFSRLTIYDARDVVFHCARDGCTNRADKVCKKCRRAWFCSRECQLAAHPIHKLACTATHSDLTRVHVLYDGPISTHLRAARRLALGGSSSSSETTTSKPLRQGACAVFKLQLENGGSNPDNIAAYDRLSKRFFEIYRHQNNTDTTFDDLVNLIKTHGVMGGKAYFHVWGGPAENLVDIDARCMMPPRPW